MPSFAEQYPLELLTEREAHLRRFWAGEGPRTIWSVRNGVYEYRQLEDDDLALELAVQQITTSANLSPYNLPWFGPDFGTISTALYWGGEVIHPDGGCVFIKPVIHEADDVDRVRPSDPAGCHVARAVALAARVKARLGSDHIWCKTIDFQGPLSTAGLLWDQTDFICSMYTDPEAVHRLLDAVTNQLIGMFKALRQGMGPLCGMAWPYMWMPDDLGIVFTEDFMPLMSPDLYREFGLPYLKRLADEFGGAFIHCCGGFEQHLEALSTSGVKFTGFDYCEPHTRTEAIFDAFGPDIVYHVGISPQGEERWGNTARFYEHLARVAPPEMRFWFTMDTSWPDYMARKEAVVRLFGE